MATLGFTGLGAYLGLRGGSKSPQAVTAKKSVPDKEEEQFIQFADPDPLVLILANSSREFLKNLDAEEKKTKS